MRVCPVCRREYESENICPSCMIPLIDTDMEKAVNTFEEETAQKKQQKEEKKRNRRDRKSKDQGIEIPGVSSEPSAGEAPASSDAETGEYNIPSDTDADNYREPSGTGEYGMPSGSDTDTSETWAEPSHKQPNRGKSGRTAAPEKRERASSSMNLSSIDPKLIVILAVIVFVVIAVIFIVKGRVSDKNTMQDDSTTVTVEADTDTMQGTDTEETDLSDVDINAVSDAYAEFTGTLSTRGDEYMVKLDTAYTIYTYNDSGEPTVMKNVNQIILNDAGGWDLEGSVGGEVTVSGYLEISDQDMTMTLVDFFGTETEDTAIHTYQIILDDCTWEEAMQNAQNMGGYLVRINTREEYDTIISMLSGGSYSSYHFYLGGRRNSDGTEYYWVDENNQFLGDCLNADSSWCTSAWYNGEPSFEDAGSDAVSVIQEDTMNLFCVGGTWYLNDSSGDLPGNYPDLLSGKVGYIVEIE
ncbi:MAG: hypothetical protein LUG54_04230 [Clostridiales bacterium]|nr:hypothetical protein [Clostridiales bacterium]